MNEAELVRKQSILATLRMKRDRAYTDAREYAKLVDKIQNEIINYLLAERAAGKGGE